MNMHICEEVHCYKGEFSEPREAAAKNYIYSSIFYPCIYIYMSMLIRYVLHGNIWRLESGINFP